MTPDARRENVTIELEKGAASLRAARLCLEARLFDDAASRAYYAAYHHLQAVLFSAGIEAYTHASTHDLFYLHFVRKGALPPELGRAFAALEKGRKKADYGRAFRFDERAAREAVDSAGSICASFREWLSAAGWIAASS